MRHPAGITHTTSLSTTPRAGRDRPSLFLRLIAWVLMVTISTSSFAQAVGPMARGGYGQPYTGFTKNGTFVQGGVVVGNPHQEQHDLLKPGLWTTAAASFTNSTDPSFIQSNLAAIEASIAVTPEPGGRAMSRLYITIPPAAPTANPYLDPSAGAPGCDPATTCNQAIYNQLLLDAQANGYSSVGNDGLGASTHIAKTHDSSSDSIYNRGFGSYQNKPVFQAAENPQGGATAFFLLQDAAAASHLRVLQNQSVANLGGLIFYTQQTLKGPGTGLVSRGYDGEVYDPGAEFDRQVGSAPSSLNRDSHNGSRGLTGYQVNPNGPGSDFQIGYIQPDGQAHAFDLVKDPHFRAFQNSAGYGAGEWGSDLNTGSTNNALLGANLRTAAIQNQKGQQAVANLSFEWAQDDRALFYQGINLYNYGNKADNALLRQLELGQITAGSADYVRARALAEQRFKEAYAAQVEYELKAKFTKEGAKYQAEQLNFAGFDADKLFNSGLNLFDKKGDPEQERLLRELKAGNLKPGDARYDEIRGLAEARYRVAYQKALEPPKKANPLKALVAVVVAAVVTFYTAGAASGWAAAAMSTTTTTVTVGVGTAGVAAAGVGTAIGAYAGTVISTGIQTGSLDKALAAGENSLKGSLAKVAVDLLAAQLGLPASGVGGFAVKAVGNAVTSVALSGGDFGQALLQGSINAGVEIVAKDVANQIGAAKDTLGAFGVELAHAGVGCASALARGGNSESCGAGATGAAVGHLAAGWVDSANGYTLSEEEVAFFGKTIGGVGAALVGSSDKVQENFGIGQTTADNAVVNNYLTTRQELAKAAELEGCSSVGCKAGTQLKYQLISAKQDAGLLVGLGGGVGLQTAEGLAAVVELVQNWDESYKALKTILSNPEYRTQVGDAIFKDYEGRLDMLNRAYNDGGWDGSVTAGVEAGRLGVDILGVVTGVAGAAKISTQVAATGSKAIIKLAENIGSGPSPGSFGSQLGALGDVSKVPKPVGANGGVAIPSGFKPFNVEGLPAGSTGVVNAAGEIRVLTPTGALTDIPATPIPANINASVVPQSATGIKFGGDIKAQGLPFETYLEGQLPVGTRLPPNTKTFDFFDRDTGIATSAKTLDTTTVAKITDPTQVYYSLKTNVDATVNFTGANVSGGAPITSSMINGRVVQVAIPEGTTAAQWAQINKAIEYANSNNVTLKIVVVKP